MRLRRLGSCQSGGERAAADDQRQSEGRCSIPQVGREVVLRELLNSCFGPRTSSTVTFSYGDFSSWSSSSSNQVLALWYCLRAVRLIQSRFLTLTAATTTAVVTPTGATKTPTAAAAPRTTLSDLCMTTPSAEKKEAERMDRSEER